MQTFSNYIIDQQVYTLVPSKKHLKKLTSEDPLVIFSCKTEDAPLTLPPNNSSEETRLEMLELKNLQTQHPEPAKLEKDYDDDFLWAFKKICKDNNLEFDKKFMKALIKEAGYIIIKLKYKFNRPRPFQLAKAHGLDLIKYDSETAKTPSYPSGHTTQGRILAMYLSKLYPEFQEQFEIVSDTISMSRMVGCHHFPSDVAYGNQIATWMVSNIK
jgi:acid phosphatase (class A)|tara:strand:- start:482 stop:1123 length:642 start_codon:yes stop_codon:yes gene_type:complete